MQRTTSSPCSRSRARRVTGSGSRVTSPLVVLPVPPRCFSCTRLTMPVLVLPTMRSPRRVEEPASSTVSSMSTRRLLPPMVLPVSTVASFRRWLVSLCTAVSTSVSTTPSVRYFFSLYDVMVLTCHYRARRPCWCPPGFFPGVLPPRLGCHHWCWSRFLPSGHHPVSLSGPLRETELIVLVVVA